SGGIAMVKRPKPSPDDPVPALPRDEVERLCMRNLLENPDERVYFKDLESRFLFVSRGWMDGEAPGWSVEDVLGKTDFDIFSEPHAVAAFDDEQRIIRTGEPIVGKVERETFRDRPDVWVSTTKFPLTDGAGQIIGTFGISRDVTAQIVAEQALTFQSLHDAVTGLPNRVALRDRLSQALALLERQPGRLALFFVDLDNFKTINDSFGHETGDKVLVEVARRLTGTARRADTVARLGGDEFVMLCTGLRGDDDPRVLGDRVVRAVGRPYVEDDLDLSITASVGVVLTGDPLADPGELLRDADIAMYRAKDAGKNCFQVFSPSQRDRVLANHALEAELREALDASQLFLLYQPLFSIEDRSLRGVEALVRWNHPTRGVVPPLEFIPLAEERGLITRIDGFVLDEACRQLAAWLAEGGWAEDFTMAVNISGREFLDPHFPERVGQVLAERELDPARLCLEITETAFLGEAGSIEATLGALSALGVRIALDDFGTGYSTLSHLQRLQVDILKIDGSFVEHIGRSARDREIVGAVTAMVHALGMLVVAEAIETAEQLNELSFLQCDVGQGFLFSRPIAPEAVAELRRVAPLPAPTARPDRWASRMIAKHVAS
ncbi:MAG TPA: EAL domain-containing protein, partial [Acidimicrobiales bacterium]|nr:EAL domain-containing protein [Acidimicrobiales bacterium]